MDDVEAVSKSVRETIEWGSFWSEADSQEMAQAATDLGVNHRPDRITGCRQDQGSSTI